MPDNNVDFDAESENELECTTNSLSAHRHLPVYYDSFVCGNLPSEEKDSRLYHLFKTFQMHCHSKLVVNKRKWHVVLNLRAFLQEKS